MNTNQNISLSVFDPGYISTLAVESIKRAQADPDFLTTGIPVLDDHYVMYRPRKVNGILAYTSHGKTSLMHILSRNFIPQLRENEIVVYATWEDSVEDFGLNWLASASQIPVASLWHGNVSEADWQRMMKAAAERAATPLWAIGHSEQGRRPMLTVTDLERAMEYIVDVQEKKVRALFVDYLQRVNRDDIEFKSTRNEFVEVMNRLKNIALGFNTCVIVGSQAKREVRDRKWKQPQENDAQETSNFEQTADGIITLWLPYKTEKIGECLVEKQNTDDIPITVTKRLMLIQTAKQKRGEAPVLRAVDFYPETNQIKPYYKGY